ncbi:MULTISPECIES: hypothetical protein [Burkholderia]|uniref:hypothetical protein n=1 Tax=Burkholderia TaxID=32008 RepID=UPI00126A2753|nr:MULTISPECIES: hypothetical protein [Burkholderia]
MKHFRKMGLSSKPLSGKGLRDLSHVVSRKMSPIALGNGGVWMCGVWRLKIDVSAAQKGLLNTYFVVFDT